MATSGPNLQLFDSGAAVAVAPGADLLATQEAGESYELKLLSYNIFLRPEVVDWILGSRDRADCRAAPLADVIKQGDFDIVALQETQHQPAWDKLDHRLGSSLPFRLTGQPSAFAWADTRPVNGGNSLLSRYPIERFYTESYRNCTASDCLARKGFVHVLIKVAPDFKVNVVGTHLNSGSSMLAWRARRKQLIQLGSYLNHEALIKAWPTVLLGDLNVDAGQGADVERHKEAMAQLVIDGLGPPRDPFGVAYEDDAALELANSRNCTGSRVIPCKSPNDQRFSDERRRLDYVLVWDSGDYEVEVMQKDIFSYKDTECGTRYLSDHQAPFTQLRFQKR
ncbi:MAG: endonuclease/exonuclease/phosphatase family protein [Myxococcales bacterium]|nr:MAG: endonuclease/exonuclease/phosphatase family protein [Myxococcales bacterium]